MKWQTCTLEISNTFKNYGGIVWKGCDMIVIQTKKQTHQPTNKQTPILIYKYVQQHGWH